MVIAFIPVRGGSRSIPLKNIKPFCGKPLVCWNIEALEHCNLVDKIVVATDSDKIEEVVNAQCYSKTKIYRRLSENATDFATSESVMLEYIQAECIPDDYIFMLVQATSPLTETIHFTEALEMFYKGEYDSILSCVRNCRFFWSEVGNSINYDYRNRPRRQDFPGIMMENGAFYISTVGKILQYRNRLCGHIGIYEMPGYTGGEIDEPDDWIVLERLMYRHVLAKRWKSNIKLFLCDVDGTLTDGGMYYSDSGCELKKFNTRDGMGFCLLHEAGIRTGIITSEKNKIVEDRAQKLNVDFLYQGYSSDRKLFAAKDICKQMQISLDDVAYIGDDLNCRELLQCVGVAACPNDAISEIKILPNIHIMSLRGGEGAVREFVNYLLCKDAAEYINSQL